MESQSCFIFQNSQSLGTRNITIYHRDSITEKFQMFSEAQQAEIERKFLEIQVKKSKASQNVLSRNFMESSFTNHFDQRLTDVVLKYAFDFDRVALHLYYEFPQFDKKITSRTVAFRWWQLERQKQILHEKSEQKLQQESKGLNQHLKPLDEVEKFSQSDSIPLLQQKGQICSQLSNDHESPNYTKYEQAITMSEVLTEEEQTSFILYKPRFIMDTEFRLEKYESNDETNYERDLVQNLNKVIKNEMNYDFGKFDEVAEMAGAMPESQWKLPASDSPEDFEKLQDESEQQYMDEEWEQYESD